MEKRLRAMGWAVRTAGKSSVSLWFLGAEMLLMAPLEMLAKRMETRGVYRTIREKEELRERGRGIPFLGTNVLFSSISHSPGFTLDVPLPDCAVRRRRERGESVQIATA